MKNLMIMASAVMMAAAANASEVNTVAFKETRVNLPARVRFVKGNDYGFNVEAKDSLMARNVQCSVKDGVLRITYGNKMQPGESKYDVKKNVHYYGVNATGQNLSNGHENEEMVITVIAPDMPKLRTSADYVAVSVK